MGDEVEFKKSIGSSGSSRLGPSFAFQPRCGGTARAEVECCCCCSRRILIRLRRDSRLASRIRDALVSTMGGPASFMVGG